MNSSDNLRTWEPGDLELKNLTPEQVQKIDEFLASVGDYGEVDLIVQHGELRYINSVQSHKARTSGEEQEK